MREWRGDLKEGRRRKNWQKMVEEGFSKIRERRKNSDSWIGEGGSRVTILTTYSAKKESGLSSYLGRNASSSNISVHGSYLDSGKGESLWVCSSYCASDGCSHSRPHWSVRALRHSPPKTTMCFLSVVPWFLPAHSLALTEGCGETAEHAIIFIGDWIATLLLIWSECIFLTKNPYHCFEPVISSQQTESALFLSMLTLRIPVHSP